MKILKNTTLAAPRISMLPLVHWHYTQDWVLLAYCTYSHSGHQDEDQEDKRRVDFFHEPSRSGMSCHLRQRQPASLTLSCQEPAKWSGSSSFHIMQTLTRENRRKKKIKQMIMVTQQKFTSKGGDSPPVQILGKTSPGIGLLYLSP